MNSSTLRERSERVVEELQLFPDAEERLFEVIRRGKVSPGLDAVKKTEDRLVPGCVSNLYLVAGMDDGKCRFSSDADAFITKGVAALVCWVYDGAPANEIVELPVDFIERAGIQGLLSPNRANGLSQLLARIRGFARTQLSAVS